MAEHIIHHLDAVRDFLANVTNEVAKRNVLAAQRAVLQSMLQRSELCMADAARVLNAVKALSLDDETTAMLTELLADKACAMSATESTVVRARLQNYAAVTEYYPEAAWQMLLDANVAASAKLDLILGQCEALQLRSPTEGTWQVLTALLLLVTDGPVKAVSQPAAMRHGTLQTVKKRFRSLVKNSAPTDCILDLPANPADLRAKFRKVYDATFTMQPPVPARVETNHLESVRMSIPLRSTSKLMSPTIATPIQQSQQ